MTKKTNTLTGITGEYYVAAELSKKGFFAAITLRNNEGYDILATYPESKKHICVQVKTTWNRRQWILNKKVESSFSEDHFYVLVNLFDEDKRPEYFIINSIKLAEIIKSDHEKWCITPGRKGQPHNDNDLRQFNDNEGTYLEKWESLLE